METDTEYSYARDWIVEMKGIDFHKILETESLRSRYFPG